MIKSDYTRILKIMAMISLACLLEGCGPPQPAFQTTYEMVPPPTDNGRMCANNCLMMQQNCRASCGIQQQQCAINHSIAMQNAQVQADIDFDNYVHERQALGRVLKRNRDSFYNAPVYACDDNAYGGQCANDYNTCFTNCGGQIIPHTACVANCHLIGPGQVVQ